MRGMETTQPDSSPTATSVLMGESEEWRRQRLTSSIKAICRSRVNSTKQAVFMVPEIQTVLRELLQNPKFLELLQLDPLKP